jgi:hypothetical protein
VAQPIDEMDQRAREIGRHQPLFREVNGRIEELAETFDLKDELAILCECGSGQCDERIALREDQYEQLRRVPTHFAVRPGHEIPDVERVVERHDEFVVVEKFGESASRPSVLSTICVLSRLAYVCDPGATSAPPGVAGMTSRAGAHTTNAQLVPSAVMTCPTSGWACRSAPRRDGGHA